MHLPQSSAITATLLLLGNFASAAISVSGIATRTTYTGGQSFTVDDPADFTTTATLNGSPTIVGASVSVEAAGFYQLVVSETPEAGGKTTQQTFLFNIREPGRGNTETGLPAFNAVPLVNDAPSAINTGRLVTVTPAAFPDDLPIPVITLLQKVTDKPLWLNSRVNIANQPDSTVQMRRGFGYTFLPAGTDSVVASTASLRTSNPISIEDNSTLYTPISGSIESSVDFGDNARLEITDDVTVESGVTVTIGAGGIVRLAPGADIHVDGSFTVNATPANPTSFVPTTPGSPWGGFFLQEDTSKVEITGAILHGNGAEQNWFNANPGFPSHRKEQAMFLVDPAGAKLYLTDSFLIESAGQFLHNRAGGDIIISRCLLQGATTCGELNSGSLTIESSALLLFPDENPSFADGDNDAIYLNSGQHHIFDTVIGYTQDDGIDTGGSPVGYSTNSTAESCWFESILHEAMSNSGQKNCFAADSVFFNCGQAIECGYGGPRTLMHGCLAVANVIGARFGDNYNWEYAGNHLTVLENILIGNQFHDIWGYDWASWSYNFDQMTVSGNKISIAEDLARHTGDNNSTFDPVADAELIAPFMPVPGSNVGIAIIGTPAQSTIASYPSTFDVQLSTFSSNVVTASYSLTGSSTVGGPETELTTGTLVFSPSETRKTLNLPPPAGEFALVRLALHSISNAEDTGGGAWYLNPSLTPTPLLIDRGSDWSYSADRAEPAAGWQELSFDDSLWKSGPTPIGYGDGDEATELTEAERGPSDDRTTAVYFRKTFQVSNPSSITALTLNLQRDDGAVIYLNGDEVARSNIDEGPVSYTMRASGSAGNSIEENAYYEIPLQASALTKLRSGDNVIAVEVHQSSLSSSDLSFDLDLVAERQQLDLLVYGENVSLFWLDREATLQSSNDLINWVSTDGQSPYRIGSGTARKFYRLVFP